MRLASRNRSTVSISDKANNRSYGSVLEWKTKFCLAMAIDSIANSLIIARQRRISFVHTAHCVSTLKLWCACAPAYECTQHPILPNPILILVKHWNRLPKLGSTWSRHASPQRWALPFQSWAGVELNVPILSSNSSQIHKSITPTIFSYSSDTNILSPFHRSETRNLGLIHLKSLREDFVVFMYADHQRNSEAQN